MIWGSIRHTSTWDPLGRFRRPTHISVDFLLQRTRDSGLSDSISPLSSSQLYLSAEARLVGVNAAAPLFFCRLYAAFLYGAQQGTALAPDSLVPLTPAADASMPDASTPTMDNANSSVPLPQASTRTPPSGGCPPSALVPAGTRNRNEKHVQWVST